MATTINRNKETILLITVITAVLVMAAIIYVYYKNLPPPAPFPPAEASASQDKDKGKNDADHARLDMHEKNMLRVALIETILRKSMRNPDSFKMDSAIVPPSGAVCMEYRAQNGFGGMNQESAVVTPAFKLLVQGTDDGFHTAWRKYCTGKTGEEFAHP